ncbi:uncharacterized protein ACB058_002940 [Synchiropus picturatus]
MAADGVKADYVTPPYLTITSPSHFTLITGRYIENHGVIHNMWFNTSTQEKKQYYMTQFVDSYWDNGSLPIWITAQRQGLKAGSLHFPGTAATYRGETVQVKEVEPRFYDYSNETDWRLNVDKVIADWFFKQDLDFVSLYFGEPDKVGHKYGPDSPERRAMIQQVDRTVGYIRERILDCGLTDRLNIMITADHGMTTVMRGAPVQEIILSKIPGFSFKDIKFHLVDYGPSGMLLPKEGMLEKVYQALKVGHPHLHVYKKEEMPERLHYSKHPRLLPLILFADRGYVINGLFPVQFNKGEHGFDNQVLDMKPLFRAVGPDFRKNLVVGPFETVNVYALMCHLLKIAPEVNDGLLERTRHMLVTESGTGGGDGERDANQQAVIGLSAVCGFLFLVFIVATSYTCLIKSKEQKRPTRNKLLLISFDGFRWDYDRDVETPYLDKMALDGVKAAYVTPPFITITSPAHFSMLTGRYVENHGVIHNMWFNTTTQERRQYYDAQFVDSFWDNGSLPIWITAQRQGLQTGSLHFPGTAATYRGEVIHEKQVEPRNYNHSNETDWKINIDKVIGDWFLKKDLDFVSLYFGEPDLMGHKYGPDSPQRRAMVQQVDRTVGYLRDKIRECGLSERLNVIITADHGMTEILRGGAVQEIILAKIPGLNFKDIQFQLLDYGPLGMLLPKEGKLEKVYKALRGSHPHLHVYKKEDVPTRLHYSTHSRLLPLILMADPGYIVNGLWTFNFNKGDHGFDNENMEMKAIFRAVGPDFQRNQTVDPFNLIDVYPLMCHLLGITPEVNDGLLENTKHMLIQDKPVVETDADNTRAVWIALAAVIGCLVVVFVIAVSYSVWKRSKA